MAVVAVAIGGAVIGGSAYSSCSSEAPGQPEVKQLLEGLQRSFVAHLATHLGVTTKEGFQLVHWLRDGGKHGGGARYELEDTELFNRASVNVSAVNYEDEPKKIVDSATALSVILHPKNPHAPSMHFHISWTKLRNKPGTWRMIADLNPAIPDPKATAAFHDSLQAVVPPQLYAEAKDFGDRYFFIPDLDRHRGAAHLFVGSLGEEEMDMPAAMQLAQELAESTIRTYTSLVRGAIRSHPGATNDEEAQEKQLAYHTLYFYQVLTLDRGTTAGLLSHSQNDVGTLGSIPNEVDRDLLTSWVDVTNPPRSELLKKLISVLPEQNPSPVTSETRKALAEAVRTYYSTDRANKMSHQAEMDMKCWTQRMKMHGKLI